MSALPDFMNERPGVTGFDAAVLSTAMLTAQRDGANVLDVLEQSSGLDSGQLAAGLAAAFDHPYWPATELFACEPAFDRLGAADALRRSCVLVRQQGRLVAVIADPLDGTLRPWLESRIPEFLDWAVAARGDIQGFISRHEQSMRAIDTALEGAQGAADERGDVEALSLASISQDASPVVKLVHSTLFDALRGGASDIHLETSPAGLVIRYRIDGVLSQVGAVSGLEIPEQVISRIKVMSELDIAERRIPQDGRFKVAIEGRAIDFRVSIIPSVHGEDAVLRVLDKQAITDQMQGLRLDALGFDARIVERLRRLSTQPHGMLLVTGPTGSGKTTTLYAALTEGSTGAEKVVTIEDPVEYQLGGVLQIPVNEKKGLTFARGLRSILRHDPDKIMVGEIRDAETAQIAIQSALTGHLVFTTVHANSVFDVLSRFMHMGVDPYALCSALNGILAQRLIRIVCPQCAEQVTPDRATLEESGIPLAVAADFHFRVGRGCKHCRGSGYRGRRAIGELLVLNDELREAIVARAPVRQLKELAIKSGSRFMRVSAIALVKQGLTTLEEVNRVTAMA